MRKRFKMSKRSSRRSFRRGSRVHKRNRVSSGTIRRGGMRM